MFVQRSLVDLLILIALCNCIVVMADIENVVLYLLWLFVNSPLAFSRRVKLLIYIQSSKLVGSK